MNISKDEIQTEIRKMQNEYKREWRRKNPERSRELDRASIERRALRRIEQRRAEGVKNGAVCQSEAGL